jgi:hypothetical protein
MATSIEVQHRQSYARALLERGVANAAVATMLSARFHISRSSAYSDLAAAHAEIDLSDDGRNLQRTLQVQPLRSYSTCSTRL